MPKRYIPNDKWSQQAQKAGYRARSVYKLKELDEKFTLLQSGMTVLDLGAAPGSWLQYVVERIGSKGHAIGVDLQEIAPIVGPIKLHQADITDDQAMTKIIPQHVDLVLSDLAPKTSGVRDVDQWKSIELAQVVIDRAYSILERGSKCIVKVFRGADFDEFLADCKKQWHHVKPYQPKACRDRSFEIYLVLTK